MEYLRIDSSTLVFVITPSLEITSSVSIESNFETFNSTAAKLKHQAIFSESIQIAVSDYAAESIDRLGNIIDRVEMAKNIDSLYPNVIFGFSVFSQGSYSINEIGLMGYQRNECILKINPPSAIFKSAANSILVLSIITVTF